MKIFELTEGEILHFPQKHKISNKDEPVKVLRSLYVIYDPSDNSVQYTSTEYNDAALELKKFKLQRKNYKLQII